MPSDFEIRGLEQLEAVAIRLKSASDGKELRKDLLRGIRAAGKPLVTEIKTNLGDELPHSGGLNTFFKKSSIGIRTRTAGKSVGIRLVAQKKGHDIAALDRGKVRHPLYGNRKRWYAQSVEPGLVSKPVEASTPTVQKAVLEAMNDIADRIA